MDFALTDEQQALRVTARAWLARHAALAPADDTPAQGAGLWPALDRLGWLDPDLGMVELAVLAEESGAALLPAPWLATIGLAAPAYRAAGRWPDRPATLAWAEPPPGPDRLGGATVAVACRAVDTAGGIRLSGVKRWVPDTVADVVVVARGPDRAALYLVDVAAHPEVVHALSGMDPSRPLADLRLADTDAEPLVDDRETPAVLRETRRRTLALLAAEAVGVARQALALAVTHAKTRTQFGRPIGAYQGVAHPLADAAAAVELARSLAYRSAWCVHARAPEVDEAVVTATVAAREAALRCCTAAVQTLGGTGFTWAHPLHRLYRRARWIAGFDGSPATYRAELATLLLDADRDRDADGHPADDRRVAVSP